MEAQQIGKKRTLPMPREPGRPSYRFNPFIDIAFRLALPWTPAAEITSLTEEKP
jgi:hypothetical protein